MKHNARERSRKAVAKAKEDSDFGKLLTEFQRRYDADKAARAGGR